MLTTPLSTLAWIIQKARVFDAGLPREAADPDDDDGEVTAPADNTDPAEAELTSWIEDLTETQRAELVAIFWLGRDDGEAADFPGLVEQARVEQSKGTARYLLGSPLVSDYLEEGLERLGIDVAEMESEAL